jgi:hypothetical protein
MAHLSTHVKNVDEPSKYGLGLWGDFKILSRTGPLTSSFSRSKTTSSNSYIRNSILAL